MDPRMAEHLVVPMKAGNRSNGTRWREGDAVVVELLEGKMSGTQGSINVSTKEQQIANLARTKPGEALTTLAHHMDIDWLREAFRRTRKDGAPGADGMTAAGYEVALEDNLRALLDRAKSGSYTAPPVRRVHIPKGDGKKTRPIGIPTFEDKVLQRAIAMMLQAVYEQDFHECSYGFRPGRGAHMALDALRSGLMKMGGGWVIELDIERFFDTLDHSQLREILDQRIRDGVVTRLIGKWLNAGVLEGGSITRPDEGTPQGGVVSPILANVYLHEVLDLWFERDVKPRLQGQAFLVRYADDAVLIFEREEDVRRVMDVLPKRFGRYGLKLHPEKTQVVEFRRPPKVARGDSLDRSGPGTFNMLGFTHVWGKSLKGYWVVRQKTAKDRFRRGLKRLAEWCRANMHTPIGYQWATLVAKLQGHRAYYGIIGNAESVHRFRFELLMVWWRALRRRSQRGMSWEDMLRLLKTYNLPTSAKTPRLKYA